VVAIQIHIILLAILELQGQQGKHNSKEGIWNLDAGLLRTTPILRLLART